MNIQGREVRLERARKILFPEARVTKGDLAQHLLRASARMLPHLKDRPLTVIRMPDGVHGTVFFQKNTPEHVPEWIPRCEVPGSDGSIRYALVNEAAALVVLADQAVGEFHGWVSRCAAPDRPDRIVFDFDPPTPERFDDARRGARELARVLETRGAAPHALLTGSRGIHLVVPLVPAATSKAVNAFADAVGRSLVKHRGDLYTMEGRKSARGDRVYIDTLRNRRNQTSIMPWSPRIRERATVAAPITIAELSDKDLDPQRVTIKNAEEWLDQGDPWEGFFERSVPLSTLMR